MSYNQPINDLFDSITKNVTQLNVNVRDLNNYSKDLGTSNDNSALRYVAKLLRKYPYRN